MNGKPHVHKLNVFLNGRSWIITYGDQQKDVRMPIFRDPSKVLKRAIADVIAKHDKESTHALDDAMRTKQRMDAEYALIKSAIAGATEVIDSVKKKCDFCNDGYLRDPRYMHSHPGNFVYPHVKCDVCDGTGFVAREWPGPSLELSTENHE